MKHKHIPFGNGHITWTSETDPKKEQLEAFEKMRELALMSPILDQAVCDHNTTPKQRCDSIDYCVCTKCGEHVKEQKKMCNCKKPNRIGLYGDVLRCECGELYN